MILEHKKYELFGKILFEKMIIIPPFKKNTMLSDEACFLHMLEGEYMSISENSTIKTSAKESLLMKCGNYLSQFPVSAGAKKYETIVAHFSADILKKIYNNDIPGFLKHSKPGNPVTGMAKVPDDLLLQKYIDGLLFYFENPGIVTEELLVLKLKELMLLLSQTKEAPLVHQILASLFSPVNYSFREVVDTHLFSDLSVTELAQLTNLSVSSFKRRFEKVYGESPAGYLKAKKLEKAAELLLATGKSMNEIADECGFSSLSNFSKSFQHRYHTAPTRYRLDQKSKSMN